MARLSSMVKNYAQSLIKGNLKVVEPKQLQKMRTQLMMVFQHFNLWSHMTVLENVIEGTFTYLG